MNDRNEGLLGRLFVADDGSPYLWCVDVSVPLAAALTLAFAVDDKGQHEHHQR